MTPGVHLKKRAEEERSAHDDCGSSVHMATLSSLAVNKEALDLLQDMFLEKNASLTADAPAYMKESF